MAHCEGANISKSSIMLGEGCKTDGKWAILVALLDHLNDRIPAILDLDNNHQTYEINFKLTLQEGGPVIIVIMHICS